MSSPAPPQVLLRLLLLLPPLLLSLLPLLLLLPPLLLSLLRLLLLLLLLLRERGWLSFPSTLRHCALHGHQFRNHMPAGRNHTPQGEVRRGGSWAQKVCPLGARRGCGSPCSLRVAPRPIPSPVA